MLVNTCSNCKRSFDRIDLWPHPENSDGFICRNCQTTRRLKKEKSFESDFRRFRERQDYVPQEETCHTSQSRISDDEFDEIIEINHVSCLDLITRSYTTNHRSLMPITPLIVNMKT